MHGDMGLIELLQSDAILFWASRLGWMGNRVDMNKRISIHIILGIVFAGIALCAFLLSSAFS